MNPAKILRRCRDERRQRDEAAVLAAMNPFLHYYGYPLSRKTGLRPSLLYRALDRLMDKGVVEDGWDPAPPRVGSGGPRRWYRITEQEVLNDRERTLAWTAGLRLTATVSELATQHPRLST